MHQLIGFGIFTLSTRKKGDFLLEYCGDLLTSSKEMREREQNDSNFLYYFICRGKKYWSVMSNLL